MFNLQNGKIQTQDTQTVTPPLVEGKVQTAKARDRTAKSVLVTSGVGM